MSLFFVSKEDSGRFDRLSSLPESLVIVILSCLEIREAVATCVLSKQWRFVWTNLPCLEVKETMFLNRMITVKYWPFLRSLSLCKLIMSHDKVGNLVSRCPVLESLELRKCRGFYCVVVGNPSVRRLCVSSDDSKLKFILAPYIRELQVCGIPVRILGASILDRAILNIYCSPGPRPFEWMNGAALLLGDIGHVTDLYLRGSTAVLISRIAAMYPRFQPQLFRLQNLAVFALDGYFHIYGIIALLRSSPNIHSLLISQSHFHLDLFDIEDHGRLDCEELSHLKFVDIALIDNVTVKLAQIILAKAPSLEEMVIRISRKKSFVDLNLECEPLLHCPRSSQKAKLIFLLFNAYMLLL